MNLNSIVVEKDGRILRGLALPFGEHAIIAASDGSLYAERFDEESIPSLPQNVPLLISHNRAAAPAGRVLRTAQSSVGLGVEAELVGTDSEIEGWQRRFAAGLMVGLSIAFRAGRPKWERPGRGMPPIKLIRDAEIEEISLVSWPAYKGASVTRLARRSAGAEEELLFSMTAIGDTKRYLGRHDEKN